MLPLRLARVPGLITHHGHGVRVSAPRYISQTPVRKARRRPSNSASRTVFPRSKSQPPQELEEINNEDENVTVNLFEQDTPGRGARRIPASHPDSDSNVLERLEKKMKTDMERIDEDSEDSEDSKIPTEASESVIRSLLSDDQRERIRRELQGFGKEGTFVSPHEIEINQDLPESKKIYLQKLNESLDSARLDPKDEKIRLALWRYYERSKMHVTDLPRILPSDAWKVLWNALSEVSLSNPNRISHIRTLVDDMVEAGQELAQPQRFARVESHFLEDDHEKALQLWEAGLQSGDAGNPDYLEMGVQMYSQTGNLTRAKELLDVLFTLYTSWDPRIIIVVLVASTKLDTPEGFEQAFALYLRFRHRLSSDLTMEDYDRISVAFLRAGQKDYALAIFRDMMLTGDLEASDLPYQTIMDRMGTFMSLSKDAKEVNSMNLDSLTYLPRRFQNKFFYASWMKKLIGMGQVDDAARIIELMYERKVKPDAKHVNGVIGGWLRTSSKEAHARAEKTAWSMIQARLDFVRERRRKALSGFVRPQKSVFDSSEGAQVPPLDEKPTPPATIETFSILVQWYLRRGMFENVRHLRNLLVDAEISMNSYFMNHLLYAERRNRTHREVWTRFEVMSRSVTPDIETFLCLWECMKSHVDPARNWDPEGYPTPRQLLARMRSWFYGLSGQSLRDARGDVDMNLYNEIVHCFCLARDLEGSFVALEALKEMWGLHPEPDTIRVLVMQVARLTAPIPQNLWKPSRRRSRQYTASQQNKDYMSHTLQVLDLITRERREEMETRGVRFEDLDIQQQGEENHRALLQLLYRVIMEMRGKSFDGNAAIAAAASEVELADLDAEKAMALTV